MDHSKTKFKVVVVGDGSSGKTSLLLKAAFNEFNESYVPTVFDNYTMTKVVDGKDYFVDLWDTAGEEGYDRLRPLSYNKSDIFLICFAINDRRSFNNIESRWHPELEHFNSENIPSILVGLKSDLRPSTLDSNYISHFEGEAMAANIKANMYVECSAKTGENIQKVFEDSLRSLVDVKKKNSARKKRKCIYL